MYKKLIVFTLILILALGVTAYARPQQADVVIVGGGIGGLSAAIEAAELGADVVVLEKMGVLGGSALISGGVVYAAGTELQRELGFEDSADRMFDYWMVLNQYKVDPAITRLIADRSNETIEWLMDLGVVFPKNLGTVHEILFGPGGLYISGVEDVPRGHTAENAGIGLTVPVIQKAQSYANITILMNTTGTDLIEEDGKIVGVKAKDKDGEFKISAEAVILATGGIGHNSELQRRYMPGLAAAGTRVNPIAVAGVTGDGIIMGERVGAELVDMGRACFILQPSFAPALGTPPWAVFVNKNGQRFMQEDAAHPVAREVALHQPDSLVWLICDDDAREGSWADVDQYVADGRVVKADTLEELAKQLGINAHGLQNTANKFNAHVADGHDASFFKPAEFLKPVANGPFYGIQLLPTTLGVPTGGLRINTDAEVQTPYGDSIPGLYACGEVTGGIIGEYPGSGSAIADAIIMGRIAGQNAVTK